MLRRISTQLTLAASIAIAFVMLVYAAERVGAGWTEFEDDVRRDHLTLGRALAETTAALIERAGPEDALLAVEEADQRRGDVRIRWRMDRRSRERAQVVASGGERQLVTWVPVRTSSGVFGVLEVSESLAAQEVYARDVVLRVGLATLLAIVACAVLVHAAGIAILQRPLRPILHKIQRVGEGDLGGPLRFSRTDELGVIAREIDQMCARLAALQERAASETEARIAALEQLRHADRLSTVGKLAAGVAHELGTPLSVVLARGKMILSGESEGAEVQEDARMIVEQTERMTGIIRQLLDFARRRTPQREPAELRALAGSVISLLDPLAARTAVELALRPGPEVEAAVDVGQVQQVLTNLAINAIQAQPSGGRVEVAIAATPDGVRIEVRDEGPGIRKEISDRIFEPFFTTKEVGEGTGLGLSVVHGIVEEHGGRIAVRSEEGQGTTFVIDLPRGAS